MQHYLCKNSYKKKIQERKVVTLELKNILAFLDYLHFAHYQHPGFLVVTGGMTYGNPLDWGYFISTWL